MTRNGNRAKVLDLTQLGWSATKIGNFLGIAPGTVYFHRSKLREQGRLV